MVHVRHGNGGGHNEPCPLTPAPREDVARWREVPSHYRVETGERVRCEFNDEANTATELTATEDMHGVLVEYLFRGVGARRYYTVASPAPVAVDMVPAARLAEATEAMQHATRLHMAARVEAQAALDQVAQVAALADWFDAQPNWREWGIGRQIRAALNLPTTTEGATS